MSHFVSIARERSKRLPFLLTLLNSIDEVFKLSRIKQLYAKSLRTKIVLEQHERGGGRGDETQ